MPSAEPVATQVRVARGAFELDVDLTLAAGQVTALVGPNGAGKSTLVRVLAGLLAPDAGCVTLGDRVLDDVATGVSVPPGDRGVAVAFQGASLFPGLDVLDNVAFGRRASGTRRAAARAEAAVLLDELGLAELGNQRPGAISGGEAARISLARALLTHPKLLLLDEPFAAVDAVARADLRRWLRALTTERGTTTVLVTHDPADAFAVADDAVVLEAGRVVQQGPVTDLVDRPRSRYVADLVGLTRWPAEVRDGVLLVPRGPTFVPPITIDAGEPTGCWVVVDPRHVAVTTGPAPDDGRAWWTTSVREVERGPRTLRVHLEAPAGAIAELDPADPVAATLRSGAAVRAGLAPQDAHPSR